MNDGDNMGEILMFSVKQIMYEYMHRYASV